MKHNAIVHQPIDWDIETTAPFKGNPWMAGLKGVFQGPDGEQLEIPGFFKGGNTWCIRFAPPSAGEWRAETRSPELERREAIFIAERTEAPFAVGSFRVDPENPRHFCYADGSPYHLLGYELNWLWALGAAELDVLLGNLVNGGFNYALINSYAYDTNWCPGRTEAQDFGPAPVHPWAGDHGSHDYSQLNPAYWEQFDTMMNRLLVHGVVAHIYFKVYNKLVDWPERRSAEEDLFFDYLVARYQAYPNVAWDFSKECYFEPDKKYVLDRLDRIRALDAYAHPITVHDDKNFCYCPPGSDRIDYVTDQNHFDLYGTLIEQRRQFDGPILNAEYAYEHGLDSGPKRTWGRNDSVETNLECAYEVAMAGGYCAHYYTNHAWDILRWDEVSKGIASYRAMRDFLTEAGWREMEPDPMTGTRGARVMFNAKGDQMLLYCRNKQWKLDEYRQEFYPSEWTGETMDIMSGERRPMKLVLGNHKNDFRVEPDGGIEPPFIANLRRVGR